MAAGKSIYMGPRLKRFRRELGLTQGQMATDLDISPSYVALLERNQRPFTADMLLRLAKTYKVDIGTFADDGGAETASRLQGLLKDPLFADIDLPPLEVSDCATSFPGIAEALLRLYTTYREEQLALADRSAEGGAGSDAPDPVNEARNFLAARRNCFPALDDAAARLAEAARGYDGAVAYLKEKHRLRVRAFGPDLMMGLVRRYDRHREEIWLADTLDRASATFQLGLQLVYLELRDAIEALIGEASFDTDNGRRLLRKALARYAAGAWMMPYAEFAREAEARGYDIESLARHFGASYEQTAHRLTTLHRPGQERVPFFFIKVDPAGNVLKRLDGAGFPFARHGGGCPLWSLHRVFATPRRIVTQWVELPDGQRFFSIARTVDAGGGSFGAPRIERAVALACAEEHADKLIYTRSDPSLSPDRATPIGVGCRLCQRARCLARAAPPIGREINRDDYLDANEPFAVSTE